MKRKNIAIEVMHVKKSFKLPTDKSWGLKMAIISRFKGVKGYTKQEVLKDVNFLLI
jgi:ABC-2 type transport system ATP-binding protein